MDRPDVGDAWAFPATSSHASAVPATSSSCLVFREANCKPVMLKVALFLCYLRPLHLASASRNSRAWTISSPSAAGNHGCRLGPPRSPPHRKSPTPMLCSRRAHDIPVNTARAPIHPVVATVVSAVAIALVVPRIFLGDARRTNNITLSIPMLSFSPGTSLRNRRFRP
ncbi:hypothetical protein K438DRAFT_1980694 [Mycena galopus ATCC 62051]|nr:hypothetical protein K438DRAFT_1980694 [Mycena galopus ATCC 62051]